MEEDKETSAFADKISTKLGSDVASRFRGLKQGELDIERKLQLVQSEEAKEMDPARKQELHADAARLEAIHQQHWSDEAYSDFYANSHVEKSLVNKSAALSEADCSSKDQLNKFQQAFAEWSGMRGGGLRFQDFKPFLLELSVELLPDQARSLWKDFAGDLSQPLGYDQALLAYLQVVGSSMSFARAPGSARRPSADTDSVIAATAALRSSGECLAAPDKRLRGHRHGDINRGSDRGVVGLGLLLEEAREFLIEEGLHAPTVEAFLQPFLRGGAVPQAAIFDFLAEQSGVKDER